MLIEQLVQRGQLLTLTLETWGRLGEAMASYNGMDVFVFGGIPEERVIAQVQRVRRTRSSPGGAANVVAHLCALELARAVTKSGDFVLFSPGAPSFDRYANFAERGDRFKTMIEKL